jgi:erythromycin esterase-like protein
LVFADEFEVWHNVSIMSLIEFLRNNNNCRLGIVRVPVLR